MTKRRTHSSIDLLPAGLRETITRMLVDDEWPDDMVGTKTGTPTYEDIVAYCDSKGHALSVSAVGRFGLRMRTLARMKRAGLIVRDVMADLTAEKASATQKAAAEMITAQIIEFAAAESLTSKEITNIARAVKDCTLVSIKADTYIREQIKEKAEKADEAISKIAKKKKIDPETLRQIREEVYGIVK